MPLSDDKRIVDLLTDMLFEMKGCREELKEIKAEVRNLKDEVVNTKLVIRELRLSVMRLADEIAAQHSYDRRITRLEEAVFGNAPKP